MNQDVAAIYFLILVAGYEVIRFQEIKDNTYVITLREIGERYGVMDYDIILEPIE